MLVKLVVRIHSAASGGSAASSSSAYMLSACKWFITIAVSMQATQQPYHLPDLQNVIFSDRCHHPRIVGIPGKVRDLACVATMDELRTPALHNTHEKHAPMTRGPNWLLFDLPKALGVHHPHPPCSAPLQPLTNPTHSRAYPRCRTPKWFRAGATTEPAATKVLLARTSETK